MPLFQTKFQAYGLDISDTSVKIMQLEQHLGRGKLKAYGSAPVPKGVVTGDTIADTVVLGRTLQDLLAHPQLGRLTAGYAVVSLPESKSFVRVVQMPDLSEAEAENAVPFEAENFIPLPIDQVYLDWQKLSSGGGFMSVLIIASPKDFVDGFLASLEKCGIRVAALEVESQSCHRALIQPQQAETVLIVNIGNRQTSLIMVEEGNLQFTSTIPIAGNSFTESLAKVLGVSSAKAEQLKMQIGLSNVAEYPNIKTSLLPVVSNLTAEIKNILKFHAEHSTKPVSKIILSGGGSRLLHLADYIGPEFSEWSGIAVELGNPAAATHIDFSPLKPEDLLGYTAAAGLALRGTA